MKRVFLILISLAIITSVAAAPVYAAGGKNHGEVGDEYGSVHQGDIGSDTASPGDNAQGNQAD